MTLEEVLNQAKQLSLVDKVLLIQEIAQEMEKELLISTSAKKRSLWGICADLGSAPFEEKN